MTKEQNALAYRRRKAAQGIKRILKSNRRVIKFQQIVDLHDSLNIKVEESND